MRVFDITNSTVDEQPRSGPLDQRCPCQGLTLFGIPPFRDRVVSVHPERPLVQWSAHIAAWWNDLDRYSIGPTNSIDVELVLLDDLVVAIRSAGPAGTVSGHHE
jgi:hypothetical protein